jgi:hypothetical protein
MPFRPVQFKFSKNLRRFGIEIRLRGFYFKTVGNSQDVSYELIVRHCLFHFVTNDATWDYVVRRIAFRVVESVDALIGKKVSIRTRLVRITRSGPTVVTFRKNQSLKQGFIQSKFVTLLAGLALIILPYSTYR